MKILLLLLSFASLTANVQAEQVITLKDGSQIRGNLNGVKDGAYTIQTAAMGQITVNAEQVVSITNPEAIPASLPNLAENNPAPDPMSSQIQAAQNKLMADPQMISEIQTLTQDPEIMPLLTDPSILQAVMAKDPEALRNNPKAQALMQNPKMQALIEKLQQQK